MNNTNIARYGSHFPLQTSFVTNSDGCGDHIFTQLNRKGQVCLYSRTDLDTGKVVGYEVIVAKHVKAGSKLPGDNVVKADYESYPGAQSFGKSGWACVSLSQATEKFSKVVESQEAAAFIQVTENKPKVEETLDIPEGEFTQAAFATMNCMPLRGTVYNVIQTLVNKGLVKISRKVQVGPGRATVMYAKA